MDVEDLHNIAYFSSYEDLEIHRLMLEDVPRTIAYKNAIENNKYYFKDKTVLDVGCGTGILSIFCAQAGARKVYAIEASNVANLAKDIVKENKLDNIIEVIHNKVEDVVLKNDEKVDIIVSEWMGFYLLHEGMLDSVLVARDKFLKTDGIIFPDSATVYVAPCSIPSLYDRWKNVYGISMESFAKCLRESKSNKPDIQIVNSEDLLAKEIKLCSINLKDVKLEDLNNFNLEKVVACTKSGIYQGLCVWFDCTFPNLGGSSGDAPVTLSTSPHSSATHWKQTVIVLPQEEEVEEGHPVAFQLDMERDKFNYRRYTLQMTMLDPDTIQHPLPCDCHLTKCILIKAFMQQSCQDGQDMEDGDIIDYTDPTEKDDDIDDDD